MPLPESEIPGRLQALFSERGIRMTSQRRAILRVIETANKHLDASQILRRAQKIDPSVDRSTVYRTLKLLKRNGLVDELDLMHIHGEGHYYERRVQRDHLHMACLRCGKIAEFVRLPVPYRGIADGNWRLLRGLPTDRKSERDDVSDQRVSEH
jgi:Fe2+ or Zn2+ uptake regulation protein